MQIASFIENVPYFTENKFIKINPFTGETLHEVSSCDLLGLIQAIQSSQKAYQAYSESTFEQRKQIVLKICNSL